MSEQQFSKLEAVLNARLRYVRAWNHVSLTANKSTFTIRWSEYQGDPDNSNFFQETTYPLKMVDVITKEQAKKLKKDIPAGEQVVLKDVL